MKETVDRGDRWERLLVSYAAGHRHPLNVAIHIVFVPVISWSAFLGLSLLPLSALGVPFVWWVAAAIFAYYLTLDRVTTAILAPFAIAILASLGPAAELLGSAAPWVAAAGFLGGYAIQFAGHAVEGSMPALVDDKLAGMLAAPLFLAVEIGGKLGIRRELYDRIEAEAGRLVAAGGVIVDADAPTTFEEFFPYYVSRHLDPRCRALHAAGTSLAFGCGALGFLASPRFFLVAPVVGYGLAWIGHFGFEKNRPASWYSARHFWWSMLGDLRMLRLIVTGRMGPELERARALGSV